MAFLFLGGVLLIGFYCMFEAVSSIYNSYSFDCSEDEKVRYLYKMLGDWILLANSILPDEIFIKIKD